MHDRDRLLQRELDGALGPAEAAAVRRLAADEPAVASQAAALHALDADLQALASPTRGRDEVLRERILARLPTTAPAYHMQVRPLDLLFAGLVAVALLVVYGLLGNAAQTLLQEAVVLTWLVGLSLLAGLALLIAPGFLRTLESGLLGRLLGRPLAIGPADTLVYRGAGAALVLGGIWLVV